MKYLLFYNNDNPHWASRWSWLVDFAGVHDVHPVCIDLAEKLPRSDNSPYNFRSLSEAMAHPHFDGHTWVWLAAGGDTYLDEYDHPADNVIYCIGDDLTGFQDEIGQGVTIKLRPPKNEISDEAEWWAVTVAGFVLYDMFMHSIGKRL
jgi:hypothetical protein